eukprot:2380136-Prymnesium_polylepis.2
MAHGDPAHLTPKVPHTSRKREHDPRSGLANPILTPFMPLTEASPVRRRRRRQTPFVLALGLHRQRDHVAALVQPVGRATVPHRWAAHNHVAKRR